MSNFDHSSLFHAPHRLKSTRFNTYLKSILKKFCPTTISLFDTASQFVPNQKLSQTFPFDMATASIADMSRIER